MFEDCGPMIRCLVNTRIRQCLMLNIDLQEAGNSFLQIKVVQKKNQSP